WLLPKVATTLWASVPDEFNNVNLAEVKGYKKYASAHPELVQAVNDVINFIDPSYGTSEEFARAIRRLDEVAKTPETIINCLAAQHAIISRALAGENSALEVAHESGERFSPPEHGSRQDFMSRLRLVQVGRRDLGIPPLDEQWTIRM